MMTTDKILLAPYYWTLKLRHFLYDFGLKKSRKSPIPAISIGNVTVGGTGKTPHTELLLRLLMDSPFWKDKNIAVLSRGYKRKTRGFQQVPADGSATGYGDEPMQIKRKFPSVTVAVDSNRLRGCEFLADPQKLLSSKKAKKCKILNQAPQDIVVLDDAFQHRALKPDLSIVLVNYNRPVYDDHLLPAGKLRDLPERISEAADAVIVTKCPLYIDREEKERFISSLGLHSPDFEESFALNRNGRKLNVFFTGIRYCPTEPVFPEGDMRYSYSKSAVIVTGIADNTLFARYLSDTYKIARTVSFPDHHAFSRSDISRIDRISREYPTSVIITTEKDSQRFLDCTRMIPETLRKRMFRVPVMACFLSENEKAVFERLVAGLIPRHGKA